MRESCKLSGDRITLAESKNLRVLINQLRRKIEKDPAEPRYIVTEPALGYRFQLPSEAARKTIPP